MQPQGVVGVVGVDDDTPRGDPICETPGCGRRCGYRSDRRKTIKYYYRHCNTHRGKGDPSSPARTARRDGSIVVGTVCRRCGFVASHPSQIQLDHILPVGLGGSRDDPDNLQLICANCHAIKSAVEDKALEKQLRRLGIQLEIDFDAEVQEALW